MNQSEWRIAGRQWRNGGTATLPIHTIQHQTPCEVTQTNIEVRGVRESDMETDVMMKNNTPSLSDVEDVSASPPTSPKSPKEIKVERRGSRTRNRSTIKARPKMTTM
jgi:hypothetical protein